MSLFRKAPQKRSAESTIPLINVVFLMLIFFLIAGTVAPAIKQDLRLVSLDQIDPSQPPDALTLDAQGELNYQGQSVSLADHLEALDGKVLRVMPDRAGSAKRLVEISAEAQELGAKRIVLIAQRGGP
ncbi:ExbD/TolR family protein [Qingshengfaniella alkalisoli]|uniref:Biopolymer transporter ExbD n=1 Tax=Qingshengfaniella alkalisoli TaxID=2599296 RepID=A0A5B8I6W6_9RHOB|nr:biopolymer transporter ExbD [Qingshengfaniella alkalisoli]QDY68236.1 biopolymer transporter ExbD [Qingshengfaniella alkalisoli]